jgi:hypothetical protein
MSQENVEIVRRASEAALRRPTDWDTVNALYHPEHQLISLTGRVEAASEVGDQGWRVGLSVWMRRVNGDTSRKTSVLRRTGASF